MSEQVDWEQVLAREGLGDIDAGIREGTGASRILELGDLAAAHEVDAREIMQAQADLADEITRAEDSVDI